MCKDCWRSGLSDFKLHSAPPESCVALVTPPNFCFSFLHLYSGVLIVLAPRGGNDHGGHLYECRGWWLNCALSHVLALLIHCLDGLQAPNVPSKLVTPHRPPEIFVLSWFWRQWFFFNYLKKNHLPVQMQILVCHKYWHCKVCQITCNGISEFIFNNYIVLFLLSLKRI